MLNQFSPKALIPMRLDSNKLDEEQKDSSAGTSKVQQSQVGLLEGLDQENTNQKDSEGLKTQEINAEVKDD